jgi:hypothetical protein
MDRYNSSSFDYSAHTASKALLDAVKTIWLSFPSDTRAAIDPVGPNAKKAGLPVPSRMITFPLGALPCSWQDRF